MKQDHKRLSKEKHEIAYVRKLAREMLSDLVIWEIKVSREIGSKQVPESFAKWRRLCKAVLKFAK